MVHWMIERKNMLWCSYFRPTMVAAAAVLVGTTRWFLAAPLKMARQSDTMTTRFNFGLDLCRCFALNLLPPCLTWALMLHFLDRHRSAIQRSATTDTEVWHLPKNMSLNHRNVSDISQNISMWLSHFCRRYNARQRRPRLPHQRFHRLGWLGWHGSLHLWRVWQSLQTPRLTSTPSAHPSWDAPLPQLWQGLQPPLGHGASSEQEQIWVSCQPVQRRWQHHSHQYWFLSSHSDLSHQYAGALHWVHPFLSNGRSGRAASSGNDVRDCFECSQYHRLMKKCACSSRSRPSTADTDETTRVGESKK